MLCERCLVLFKVKYLVDGPSIIYKRRARVLKEGSVSCPLCAILYAWLPGTDADDERLESRVWQILYPGVAPNKDGVRYGAKLSESPDSPGWYGLQLQFALESDRPLPPETPYIKNFYFVPVSEVRRDDGLRIADNTGSTSSLDQVDRWLNKCRQEHTQCQAYGQILNSEQDPSAPFQPTRLIEIYDNGIRLNQTRNTSYTYIALSHRWPTDPRTILRLTTSNFSGLLDSIPQFPEAGFSKVFADAVEVCRYLGVHHIWIDSLCIIQYGDGGADLRRELERMGDVYKHALATIAAESIENPDEALQTGMFRTRNVAMLEPMVGDASFDRTADAWESGRKQIVSRFTKKRPQPGTYFFMPDNGFYADIMASPLFTRGWVEQERILSPRVVHFTAKQVYFECYQTVANEVWPQGHPVFHKWHPLRSSTILQDLALQKAHVLQPADLTPPLEYLLSKPLEFWYQVAYKYAGRDFTRLEDKLAGISGLASGVRRHIDATPSDYLAGIWVQSLPYGLMWYTSMQGRSEEKHIRPINRYQAPSWSWASVNWPVTADTNCHAQPHDILIGVEGFTVTPIADPFGEVEHGARIVLRGTTYGIGIAWKTGGTNVKPAPKFWPEVRTGTGTFSRNWGGLAFPDERYIEGETRDRNDLRVLPVLQSNSRSQWKWLQMLILEPAGQEGLYRRFGYMNVGGTIGREWFKWHTENAIGARMTGKREEVVTII